MAFCGNCGTKVQDGVKFCPSCGQAMGTASPPEAVALLPQTEQQAQAVGQQPVYEQPVVPGAPQQADIRDAQDNKMMAILAYILFFIPLLTGAHKTSAFAKFHTNQGTVLCIAAVIWSIAYSILSAVLAFIPVIGWLLILLIGLMGFGFLVLCIVGIMNAANGRMKPLPFIGGIAIIK